MTTPPDFFSSDDNDPGRETPPEADAAPSAGPAAEAQRPQPEPQPEDSGPLHRAPAPAGERWQTGQFPQAPQQPRWQASPPQQSGPIPQVPPGPQAPHTSGPIPRLTGLQPTPPAYGTVPPQGAPRPEQTGQPPAGDPTFGRPAPPAHNNSGQHHRLAQQGYSFPPPRQIPQRDPSAPRAARRNDDDDVAAEKTSIISPETIAEAVEMSGMGGFFDDPTSAGAPQQQAPSGAPQGLFGGPMGSGEPFHATGYASGTDPAQIVSSSRQIDLTGWRKAVRLMTFGLIKPGPSAKQVAAEELIRRIRASLDGVFVVAFVNSKGGVGKTTMAVAAGNAIARERGDRVIVIDVDTDLGNLSARFHEHGGDKANIQTFAAMEKQATGVYANVRRYTVQNDDRLEMLSSQNNPQSDYRLTSTDFETTMKTVRSHYNVVILDCGTAITAPLFQTIAKQVDCLVVVASQDAPGLNGAYRTQAYLAAHGLGRLQPKTVVVLNRMSPQKPKVDVEDVATQFRQGTEHVLMVPFDDHLDEGGAIEFTRMGKKTQKAIKELAGTIARFYPTRLQPQNEGMGGY